MDSVEVARGEALADLARTYGQELVTFAFLLTRDAAQAQDLVQGVLARLAGRDLSAVENLVGYAKRSIVNDVHLHQRRQGVLQRILPRLLAVERHHGDAASTLPDRLALWSALADLTPAQRAALVLRYYEDLDDLGIAEVLGCAPATVRSHLARGLARLRPLMTEEQP